MPDVTAANYQRIEIQRNDGIKFLLMYGCRKIGMVKSYRQYFGFIPELRRSESFDKSKRSTNINSFRSTGIRSWKISPLLGMHLLNPISLL